METKTLARQPYVLAIPDAKPVQLPTVVALAPPPVVPASFSQVASLGRQIAILNATPAIALLGCAVAYGVTQAMNPNSLVEALVCLAPFVMGIAGPMLAYKVESMRQRHHARRD